MRSILFINLKRFGDIFAMANTIHSIKKESPHCEIGVLVYKEFERAANCIAGVKKVYTLDRHRLSMMTKKEIFSKDRPLAELKDFLNVIESDSWDTFYNYSNDTVSTYLTTYFTNDLSKKFIGVKKIDNANIEYSNEWSLIFNDVITDYPYTPKHFHDIYLDMCIAQKTNITNALIRNSKHDKTAKTNFDYLKGTDTDNPKRIVGIQLTSSTSSKATPKEIITQFITLIESSDSYKGVLLIAPSDKERNYANVINQEFNENLTIVEADFKALVSVIAEIDYLVTPDTAVKHIADLLQKKILEVNLGEVSFRKQGTIGENNIVFRPIISDGKRSHSLTGKDIYQGLEALDNPEILNFKDFSEGLKIYKASSDRSGLFYLPIVGSFNIREELSAHTLNIFFSRNWSQIPKNINTEILNLFESKDVI